MYILYVYILYYTLIKYVGESQSYRLRNANNFRLQRADTSAMPKSLYYKGLNMYNKMPN